jgi:hypothetical protein
MISRRWDFVQLLIVKRFASQVRWQSGVVSAAPLLPVLRSRVGRAKRGCAAALLLALLLGVLGGCETESRVVSSTWDPFREKLGDPEPTRGNADPNDPRVTSPRGYAVELTRFSGADAAARAFELTARLREQSGLADLWYADAPNVSTVYLGRFRDPRTDTARAALARARAAELEGLKPFTNAELVALSGGDASSLPELDLRNHTGQYALQVGYYDLAYGADFRRAAEEEAQRLRDEGHNAFYYHGPNRSLIALGPYNYEQAFVRRGQTDVYTPAVTQTQQQFPYNVRNGVGPNEQFTAEELGLRPSFLVLVR